MRQVSFVWLFASCVFASNEQSFDDGMRLVDVQYANACGPVSAYIAARSLDISVTMDEMADLCNWSPGKTTSLSEIRSALLKIGGLRVTAGHTTPEQLREVLGKENCVAILAVRKGSEQANHAICAVGTQDDRIRFLDYPELHRVYSVEAVQDIWDGALLLIEPGWTMAKIAIIFFWAALVPLVYYAARFVIKIPRTRSKFSAGLLLTAMVSAQLTAAEYEILWKKTGQEYTIDLGRLTGPANIDLKVSITNEFRTPLKLEKPKPSCGCLAVESAAETIPIGESKDFRFTLDTKGQRGNLIQSVLLMTNDKQKALQLHVRAVASGVWCIPSDATVPREGETFFDVVAAGHDGLQFQSANPNKPWLRTRIVNFDDRGSVKEGSVRAIKRVFVSLAQSEDPPSAGTLPSVMVKLVQPGTSVPIEVVVPLRIRAAGASTLQTVFFGVVPQKGITRSLRFSSESLTESIEGIQLTADHSEIQFVVKRDRDEVVVEACMKPNSASSPGFFKGMITASKGKRKLFEAPYHGILSASRN